MSRAGGLGSDGPGLAFRVCLVLLCPGLKTREDSGPGDDVTRRTSRPTKSQSDDMHCQDGCPPADLFGPPVLLRAVFRNPRATRGYFGGLGLVGETDAPAFLFFGGNRKVLISSSLSSLGIGLFESGNADLRVSQSSGGFGLI
jgi:hypothetical protein